MPSELRKPQQPVARGWRLEPIPSRPAYLDPEDNVRVPVWLSKNGRHVADTEMVLRPSEAELLRDHVDGALGEASAPSILHTLCRDNAMALWPGVVLVVKDGPF
ncbi:hypothetical protein AB0O76_01680 [Streptomyces sp. NPDC086554]|uniref:hypothetical protein n=1 Tax=Streptomyces sp. NPDC086554 TaxID=3154864 RepID=UPI003433B81B